MKQYLNSGLILSLLIGNAACNTVTTKSETNNPPKTIRTESRTAFSPELIDKKSLGDLKTIGGSVAGIYELNTYKDKKEGYKNTLEIEESGNELRILLNGIYLYEANGAETFKESESAGKGKLNGNTANIELLDESDATCRATINFASNQATLKVSEACQFNVELNGVYKRVNAESNEFKTENQVNLREISYDKLMDFVNDHDGHKVGEEYMISNVSPAKLQKKIPADKDGKEDYKNLFYLEEADDDGYIGNGLLVSKEMLESLAANAGSKAVTLRMQALLAESKGESDWIYRMSFVTKIQGLDKAGKILWTTESAKPEKINFSH